MANMYPDILPQSVTSNMGRSAEVQVFNALRDGLPDDCDVFYSVGWHGRKSATMDGEADFVIVDRNRGMMIIEVKGGIRVGRGASPDGWFTETHGGQVQKIKNPVEQARKNKYALLEKIKSLPGMDKFHVPAAHAVVLPASADPGDVMGPDSPTGIFVFAGHMSDIKSRLVSIWDYYSEGIELKEIPTDISEKIRKFLAPSFTLSSDWSAVISEIDRKIERLSESQFSVLDGLQRTRRAEISGGAGTGKTLLAFEKARRLAEQGMKTLLTCYNRPLADRLSGLAAGIDSLDVMTFHQLCFMAAAKAGIDHADTHGFDEYPVLLERSLEKLGPLYDAVIVDEGQDFAVNAEDSSGRSDWWTLIELSLIDPGILYIFLDRNQSVYGDVTGLPENLVPYDLVVNLRNTNQIHSYARKLYSGSQFSAGGPKGPSVELFMLNEEDGEARAAAVAKEFERLTVTIDPENIVLLTATRPLLDELSSTKAGQWIYDKRQSSPISGKSAADTIRRYKGLDAQAVILVASGEFPAEPELAYVGATRARSILSVIGTRADIDALKRGI